MLWLILIGVGAYRGWTSQAFDWREFVIFGTLALFFKGIMLAFSPLPFSVFLSAPYLSVVLTEWLVIFLYMAVPFSAAAWLKKERIKNRGD